MLPPWLFLDAQQAPVLVEQLAGSLLVALAWLLRLGFDSSGLRLVILLAQLVLEGAHSFVDHLVTWAPLAHPASPLSWS